MTVSSHSCIAFLPTCARHISCYPCGLETNPKHKVARIDEFEKGLTVKPLLFWFPNRVDYSCSMLLRAESGAMGSRANELIIIDCTIGVTHLRDAPNEGPPCIARSAVLGFRLWDYVPTQTGQPVKYSFNPYDH